MFFTSKESEYADLVSDDSLPNLAFIADIFQKECVINKECRENVKFYSIQLTKLHRSKTNFSFGKEKY